MKVGRKRGVWVPTKTSKNIIIVCQLVKNNYFLSAKTTLMILMIIIVDILPFIALYIGLFRAQN